MKKGECDVCLRTDDKAWRWRERDCGGGKTNFNPFTVFLWFLCGNLVCVYISVRKICFCFSIWISFHVFGFSFFSLNQKPAICVLWNVIRFVLARYLWDILREFRFGHLRMTSGWWPVYYTKIFNVIWIFFFFFGFKYRIW